MSTSTSHSFDSGGFNDGSGSSRFGAFDDFIRDREEPDFADFEPTPGGDAPGGSDPFADYAGPRRSAHQGRARGIESGLVDTVTRILDALAGLAGESLPPNARRQLERSLRDLLVVLRDVIDALIERLDARHEDDFEIEEIPID